MLSARLPFATTHTPVALQQGAHALLRAAAASHNCVLAMSRGCLTTTAWQALFLVHAETMCMEQRVLEPRYERRLVSALRISHWRAQWFRLPLLAQLVHLLQIQTQSADAMQR